MQGHFRKRGASWYFWVELDAGPDGKRRQKSKGGFRTRKEAERAFAEFRDAVRNGAYVEPTKTTLGQFLVDEWLPSTRSTVRPGTYEHYSAEVRRYVVPRLGNVRLSAVTPAKLNALYGELLQLERRNASRPISPTTVRRVHNMLHKALSDAVRWGLLVTNPAERADPPRPATTEMSIWTPEQLGGFLASVADDRLSPLWMLYATTGMRRGEALGLAWSSVDLAAGRLAVVRALTVTNHKAAFSEPKTAKGRRLLPLDEHTVEALRAHRKRQLEERLFVGEAWQDTGLVFTRADGTALDPQTVSNRFQQLSAAAGLPRIRLHDVRHSYATAALAAGVATKVVSERLGHSDVMITLGTYQHVLPSMQEEAATLVANLILQQPPTKSAG